MSQHEVDAAREAARRGNGQFGSHERAEGEVATLTPPRGSFLYPPILHTAQEAIAFWESVEIPDEVLQKCASAYVAQWAVATEHGPREYWSLRLESAWEAANPQPADRARMNDWLVAKDRAQAESEAHWRQVLRARPEYLDPRDVRQVAKIIGLINTPGLSGADKQAVRDHSIELTTGWVTAGEANLALGGPYFGGSVLNPSNYAAEGEEKRIADIVARALEGERAKMLAEFANVNDNVILAVKAITGYDDEPSGRRGKRR